MDIFFPTLKLLNEIKFSLVGYKSNKFFIDVINICFLLSTLFKI